MVRLRLALEEEYRNWDERAKSNRKLLEEIAHVGIAGDGNFCASTNAGCRDISCSDLGAAVEELGTR
jgi:hypothetical protein